MACSKWLDESMRISDFVVAYVERAQILESINTIQIGELVVRQDLFCLLFVLG